MRSLVRVNRLMFHLDMHDKIGRKSPGHVAILREQASLPPFVWRSGAFCTLMVGDLQNNAGSSQNEEVVEYINFSAYPTYGLDGGIRLI
jgi:hypothetical protein